MELLSRVMSSNFTLSLRSFNSDQYFALIGEETGNVVVVVFICFYLIRCKDSYII